MQTTKIRNITYVGKKNVVNLTVTKNHTFITKNGIPTHNCDALTPLAQKILRGEMERYHDITRFILTCAVGDTKVYTDYGYLPIKDMTNENVHSGHGTFLSNKDVRKTKTEKTIKITTAHGFIIEVTPDHKFKKGDEWITADNLSEDNVVDVDLRALYGNSYLREENCILYQHQGIDECKIYGFPESNHSNIIKSLYNSKDFFRGFMKELSRKHNIELTLPIECGGKFNPIKIPYNNFDFALVLNTLLNAYFDINGSIVDDGILIPHDSDILKYLQEVGLYPQQDYASFGYLLYKQTNSTTIRFDQWKEHFNYNDGRINDKIISVEEIHDTIDVYDCCFDNTHQYVTNGFISHNCNYANKLIPAIHSRVQTLHFDALDLESFIVRVGEILIKENITFEMDVLQFFVEKSYPDLRKCIGLVQQHSLGGTLCMPEENISNNKDYLLDMAKLIKQGKITEARELLVSQASPEEYDQIYRYFYDNLNIFSSTEEGQNAALLIIAKGLKNATLMADAEICLAACLVELANIRKDEKG